MRHRFLRRLSPFPCPTMYIASAQSTTAVEKTAAIAARCLENLHGTCLVLPTV
jgi:hypothetical protein